MGYESKDGVNWQLVDWQMVEMGQQVYAGVVVSSYDETPSASRGSIRCRCRLSLRGMRRRFWGRATDCAGIILGIWIWLERP